MLSLPLFAELQAADNILIAGAGGGFDIFCGLPLYFALRDAGKTVHLANLSFSALPASLRSPRAPSMALVTADVRGPDYYFPERALTRWFREQGEEITIYAFERTGVQPLLTAYRTLADQLNLDTVILVDGGTDSLMRGDEAGLGTPNEDMSSIAAVDALDLPRKLLVCLGFGIDAFHGVCHAQFLEAVAALTYSGAFLGAWSLLNTMPEVQRYHAATHYVFDVMPDNISIVSSSILSAIAGHYGDYHATPRTASSKLWINPLMTLYWAFHLPAVAARVLYLPLLKSSQTYEEVRGTISRFRAQHGHRPWQSIPV